ncbi:MAG: YggS family pyridoxal phosphate-dependent enzyme [Bacteroidetes bacterium]|nr:YggS family pyridoxal phosphate-dependent enzyme [Bacteroidota bacterium]
MAFQISEYNSIKKELESYQAKLIAVSKKKPIEDIQEAIDAGQKSFGENYVQELVEKEAHFKRKVNWHFIGHLQSNKVKMIAPFVTLIQGVDSFKLLQEINKEGKKIDKVIDCLIQVHIAQEETKFGFSEEEVEALMLFPELAELENIRIKGLMGMASLSTDISLLKKEFSSLKNLCNNSKLMSLDPDEFDTLSMGMSSDYKIALDCGSTMIRIGSTLFGERK